MKITFVAPRSWPSIGGAQAFLKHLGGALAEGHDVRFVALTTATGPSSRTWDSEPLPRFEPFTDGAVQISQVRLGSGHRAALAPLRLQTVPVLRRYAYSRARVASLELYARVVAPLVAEAAEGSDVLHAWNIGSFGAAAVRAAKLLGVPSAITPFAHGGEWGDDPASGHVYRQASRVVALLGSEAQIYERLGVPDAAVCGVCSPGAQGGDGAALRARLGIEGPLVLFLGVRRPYKGFDLLVQAAREVPGATFAFVGPGEAVAGERIIDAGLVSDAERADWLAAADLLCLPSAAEIFPSSMLEAWSVGTPALTSDIAPLAELARVTGGSIAVPRDVPSLAAALRELVADPERLRALGESGREAWEQRFTPRQVARLHINLYEQLLAERSARVA